jgi:hypothetical protein
MPRWIAALCGSIIAAAGYVSCFQDELVKQLQQVAHQPIAPNLNQQAVEAKVGLHRSWLPWSATSKASSKVRSRASTARAWLLGCVAGGVAFDDAAELDELESSLGSMVIALPASFMQLDSHSSWAMNVPLPCRTDSKPIAASRLMASRSTVCHPESLPQFRFARQAVSGTEAVLHDEPPQLLGDGLQHRRTFRWTNRSQHR